MRSGDFKHLTQCGLIPQSGEEMAANFFRCKVFLLGGGRVFIGKSLGSWLLAVGYWLVSQIPERCS
jgi:hypothetical protein